VNEYVTSVVQSMSINYQSINHSALISSRATLTLLVWTGLKSNIQHTLLVIWGLSREDPSGFIKDTCSWMDCRTAK